MPTGRGIFRVPLHLSQEGVSAARDIHDGFNELYASPFSAWPSGVQGSMPRRSASCTRA